MQGKYPRILLSLVLQTKYQLSRHMLGKQSSSRIYRSAPSWSPRQGLGQKDAQRMDGANRNSRATTVLFHAPHPLHAEDPIRWRVVLPYTTGAQLSSTTPTQSFINGMKPDGAILQLLTVQETAMGTNKTQLETSYWLVVSKGLGVRNIFENLMTVGDPPAQNKAHRQTVTQHFTVSWPPTPWTYPSTPRFKGPQDKNLPNSSPNF